jgi:hypothetical protein
MGDLMARPQDGFAGGGMSLDGPAGHEERRLRFMAGKEFEQLGYADARLVAAIGHGDEPVDIAPVHAEPDRFGIDVEAEKQGTALAVRPGEIGSRGRLVDGARGWIFG